MNKITSFFKNSWLIIAVLVLGLFLRNNNYQDFPVSGETQDEIAWSMLGSSIIQTGKPSSWSWFDAYKDEYIVKEFKYFNQKNEESNYRLVSPALDHPPLFALIPGIFHNLQSSWDQIPSIKLIRLPMIFIGTLNLYLLYLLASKIFKDKKTIYLAALIYATLPIFIFGSRLVVAENLIITWLLLTINLIHSSLKSKNLLLAIISSLAIFTKVSGIVIPLSIIFYGLQKKQKQTTKAGMLGILIGVASYLLYGALVNWQLFLAVNLAQSSRSLGLATIVSRLFLHPAVIERLFFDGWIFIGFFSIVFWLLTNPKKFTFIRTFTVLHLAFIASTTGEQTIHGWYDYPLYPLISLSIAWFLQFIYQSKNYWLTWFTWILLLPTIRLALIFTDHYTQLSNLTLRAIMALGAIPITLSLFKKDKLAQKTILFLGLILLISVLMVTLKINSQDYSEIHEFFYIQ